VEPTTQGIAGVQLFALEPHADDRGSLTEVYRREWVEDGREVVQANLTVSRPGVLRGLHWHRRQADYWCVLAGVAHVALVDLREGSPTRLATFERRIDAAEARVGIAIPAGVAHGFHAETEVLLQYLVDAPYTGEDEFGLAWDDPELGLSWPSGDPILSERDRSNPALAEVLRDPPAYRARRTD
jgi:dTDP-4-dehydrorhamnose 3,5-epimerase